MLKGGFLAFLSGEIAEGQVELLPAALALFINGNIGGDFATAWSTLTGGAGGTSYAPFPNGSNITSEYTVGELLSYLRTGDWLAPFLAGLNVAGPVAGALAASAATLIEDSASTRMLDAYAGLGSPRELHSMPLLVLLQYAWDNDDTDWQKVGANLLSAYNDDSIGSALGLQTGTTGDAPPSQQMPTEIAYSAINQGYMPFGDTGIQSLFHDADFLGQFYTANLSATLTAANIPNDLADIAVEYAGLLANNKDTSPDNAEGIFSYDQDALQIDLSTEAWTVDDATDPTIVGEADLISSVFDIDPTADNVVLATDDPITPTVDLSDDTGTDMVYAGNGSITFDPGTGTTYLVAGSGMVTVDVNQPGMGLFFTGGTGTSTVNASALTTSEVINILPGTGSISVLMGPKETLQLDLDDTASFVGSISGFVVGNLIDLQNLSLTGAVLSPDDVLVVGSTVSLQLSGGDYSGDLFQTSPDSNGGTDVRIGTLSFTPLDPILNETPGSENLRSPALAIPLRLIPSTSARLIPPTLTPVTSCRSRPIR